MAQKTLRLHNYAQHNSGWADSIFPPANSLGQLPSDCNKIATSIPSPFAQFDLAKDAFGKIAEKGNFSGETPQHRIISYALDVAQLFYQSNKHTNDIQIVAWDTQKIKTLIDNNNVLCDSLDTFWKQDARVYDFNKVSQLFFLIYRNKIIGSTSPATLFVSAPDAASNCINLNSGNHYFFKDIKGLHERDEEFILYFYQLVYQDRKKLILTELRDYLQALVNNILSYELSSKIVNEEFPLYAPCQISAGNNCFIALHQLGIALPQTARIKAESDFLLKPDYQLDEIPL
ncbi:MAG: hypothetical protein ACRC13_12485, partial [Tannerellaceae bacterium]